MKLFNLISRDDVLMETISINIKYYCISGLNNANIQELREPLMASFNPIRRTPSPIQNSAMSLAY
jgi:hypothetical protein